ncbi:hypothetical protein HTS88_12200 [Pseudarthrobacter oxydans]|uniref:hypothetical protein n=1 Tax=Pseudarthrobacter oxydans TaxID=1671 RepID=UPI0015718FF4|nr:hypothetical protein [Pseudarthrobacter oxydans]NSX37160.1 hypothetical protein [Pseudarthrobacter oxydans]
MNALEAIRARLSAVGPAAWAVMDVNDPGEGVNFIDVYAEEDGLPMICRMPDPAEYSTREGLQADAAFIAHAPSDMTKLLSAIDAGLELADKAAALCPPGDWPETGGMAEAAIADWGRAYRAAVEKALGGAA